METVELEIESPADSLSIDVAFSGGAIAALGLAGLMAAVGVILLVILKVCSRREKQFHSGNCS